jgi:tRNA 2-selenouridine synthase
MAGGVHIPVPMTAVEPLLRHPPARLIDLRSPGEHAEDRLPGAVNVPLFDDLERALVGTLYARRSPAAAFDEGRRIVGAKIAAFVGEIAAQCGWEPPPADLEPRVARLAAPGLSRLERGLAPAPAEPSAAAVVVYCWRGGLRSRAVIALLRELGHGEVLGLLGGYRAYRRWVRARVAAWQPPPSFVLRGLTGVGKTLVLRSLAELRPDWTLDLEAMAGHRSSILGMVGLEPASQKLFESRLAERFERGFGSACVVEGESRKVGDLVLPAGVWRAVDGGTALELEASHARRVRVLLDDYLAAETSRAELRQRLPFIETRLGRRWEGVLVGLLDAGREPELVELLLERYYDPLYRHSERGRRYAARFDSTDPRAAAEEIVRWIERALSARDAEGLGAGAGQRLLAVPTPAAL